MPGIFIYAAKAYNYPVCFPCRSNPRDPNLEILQLPFPFHPVIHGIEGLL